jgi:hypothetical protein
VEERRFQRRAKAPQPGGLQPQHPLCRRHSILDDLPRPGRARLRAVPQSVVKKNAASATEGMPLSTQSCHFEPGDKPGEKPAVCSPVAYLADSCKDENPDCGPSENFDFLYRCKKSDRASRRRGRPRQHGIHPPGKPRLNSLRKNTNASSTEEERRFQRRVKAPQSKRASAPAPSLPTPLNIGPSTTTGKGTASSHRVDQTKRLPCS